MISTPISAVSYTNNNLFTFNDVLLWNCFIVIRPEGKTAALVHLKIDGDRAPTSISGDSRERVPGAAVFRVLSQ